MATILRPNIPCSRWPIRTSRQRRVQVRARGVKGQSPISNGVQVSQVDIPAQASTAAANRSTPGTARDIATDTSEKAAATDGGKADRKRASARKPLRPEAAQEAVKANAAVQAASDLENGNKAAGNGVSVVVRSPEEVAATDVNKADHKPLSVRKRPQPAARITKEHDTVVRTVTKPLPRVLFLHTGGTLGMDPVASFEIDKSGCEMLRRGTGGVYAGSKGSKLRPGSLLQNVLNVVPEVRSFANLELRVVFNKDSSNVGPAEWTKLAKLLHQERDEYDAFLIVHGTDTMAFTASALSMMLVGFRKPIVLTGSQLPLAMPRSDARQNIIDAVTCLTSFFNPPHVRLQEVAICFGGRLMRGNRCQKVHSSHYQAFDSFTYPHLATLGVEVDWNESALLKVQGVYRPRFELDPRVIRVPIVPGSNPHLAYGDLYGRGVRGIVLEAFGVGNMPDGENAGWMSWLKQQRKRGLLVYLASQCKLGQLQPELYKSGALALSIGVEAGPQMTPESATVKLMQCLVYKDIPLGVSLAGEM